MTEWHPLRPYCGLSSDAWKLLDNDAEDRGKFVAKTSPARMPTLNHSCTADYKKVYEPSDDTYLLLDALKYDLFSGHPINDGEGRVEESVKDIDQIASDFFQQQIQVTSIDQTENRKYSDVETRETEIELLKKMIGGQSCDESQLKRVTFRLQQLRRLEQIKVVMEIGTGSGVPITYLSKRLMMEKPLVSPIGVKSEDETHKNTLSIFATDMNPMALQFARRTAEENGVYTKGVAGNKQRTMIQKIEFLECDIATPLLERLGGKVDILLFNPPYVPTKDEEISGSGIEISWAGGKDGRRVIDRALPQIAQLLQKPNGVCYMITVDDNLPSELAFKLGKDHGLGMVPLVRRRAWNEYLSVQKISWL